MAALLLDRGAAVDARNSEGITPLYIAAQYGRTEVAALLLWRGAAVDALAVDDSTPLHIASEEGHADVCRVLLQHGADVEAENVSVIHARCDGVRAWRAVVTCLLVPSSALAPQNRGFRPLHTASQWAHPDAVSLLLSAGADVHAATVCAGCETAVSTVPPSRASTTCALSRRA